MIINEMKLLMQTQRKEKKRNGIKLQMKIDDISKMWKFYVFVSSFLFVFLFNSSEFWYNRYVGSTLNEYQWKMDRFNQIDGFSAEKQSTILK